jgi:hypothetical protein
MAVNPAQPHSSRICHEDEKYASAILPRWAGTYTTTTRQNIIVNDDVWTEVDLGVTAIRDRHRVLNAHGLGADFTSEGSDRLARGLVGMGSAEEAAEKVTAHLDAGADHVVVQIVGENDLADPWPGCTNSPRRSSCRRLRIAFGRTEQQAREVATPQLCRRTRNQASYTERWDGEG